MSKVFKARYAWRSAGFVMTAISSFLSYGVVALVVIGLVNNAPKDGRFNWAISLVIFGVALLAWAGMLGTMALLLQNTPRSVRLEAERVTVENKQGREIEIPFTAITMVRRTDVAFTYWKFPASFRGLLIRYTDPAKAEPQDYILSARDTNNFDGLLEQLQVIAPRPSRTKPKLEPALPELVEESENEGELITMDDYERTKAAIQGQSQLILATLAEISPEQWYAPTKLADWNVLTLAAHIMRALETLIAYGANSVDEVPVDDRKVYFRFNGAEIAAAVTQRALEGAAKTSPETITSEFSQNLAAALALLEEYPASRVIRSLRGPITLGEYAPTRVLELTVHSLDLALALNQPPRYDPAALAITVEILEALLDQPRPAPLVNDDVAFVAAASGRVRVPGLALAAFS